MPAYCMLPAAASATRPPTIPAAIRPEVAACLLSTRCGMEGFAGPEDEVAVEGFAVVAPPDALVEAVDPEAGFAVAAAAALVWAVPVEDLVSV